MHTFLKLDAHLIVHLFPPEIGENLAVENSPKIKKAVHKVESFSLV